MSSDTHRLKIDSLNRELARLHRQLGDERKRESDKLSRIGQIERSISGTSSVTSVQNKTRDIQRINRDIEQNKRTQADITKKIGDIETKKYKEEQNLYREQAREQTAFQKRQERKLATYKVNVRGQLSAAKHSKPSGPNTSSECYDVFISHASEDKDEFVRALADSLVKRDIKVWYDELTLQVGDSLRRSIDRGLADSRFGIVVLSSHFFAKRWPQHELDGLVTKEITSGGKVILPIWHKVSKDEVAEYSLTLADKVALNTGILTLDQIIDELFGVLKSN